MTGERILLIDDEKAVVDSFGAHLEDCGYGILTAENGRIGLERFRSELPDLVVVDLRMPEMDGIQVLETIRGESPLTPLIVASGTGIITDAVEALHSGAWDYLLKPIEDLDLLTHAVQTVLEKAQLKRENLQYREHLEQLVTRRTLELEEANAHLSQINSRLRHIVDTTRSLSFCSEVEEFGSQLLEEFGQHMLATGGSIYLMEKDGLRLVHALDKGHAPAFIPLPLPAGSMFEKAISGNQPILTQNIGAEAGVAASGWSGYRDGSALVFPLPDESGGIAGVMTLHSKTPPPFVEQDREIGTILASYSCEALRAVKATEELRESEARFRTILDSIPAGIIIVDAASYEVLYINPAASAMVGERPEAILGRICHEVLCPAEAGNCPARPGREMEQSKRFLLTADGREVPVLKTVSPTTLEGRECFMECFIDLTAQAEAEAIREKLESQLRQAQKMEALGTLAGGIAHDFNNILSAVLGYSELGLRDLESADHPLYPKLQAINHAGLRAKELVEQILAFSRMQEQLQAPIRISPIIKEALKLLKSSLPARIQVRTSILADQPILGDPTQIHQIIMNLCTNAYHAMLGHGGVLTVTLDETAIDTDEAGMVPDLQPGEYLRLRISDTGSGISPGIIERIFDPYFTTKDKDKGTGLGLAVVHGLVKRHGGSISVESRVGDGTEFCILLPVCGADSMEGHTVPTMLPTGSEHVLLVDDERDLVDIGTEMLRHLGYRVSGVVGSARAVERFNQDPWSFDLVITDYNMPGLSGDELARKMLAVRKDLPIIVCTGFSEVLDQQYAQALGIRRVLMKPMSMETLAHAVREVVEGTAA